MAEKMELENVDNKQQCLYRLNRLPLQEHHVIILNNKDSIVLGRAESCDVVLTESRAISKVHALLQRISPLCWTITDCKSGNGVYVNNSRLQPEVPHMLQHRDIIEVGRDTRNTQALYYRFQYYAKARIIEIDGERSNAVEHASFDNFFQQCMKKANEKVLANAEKKKKEMEAELIKLRQREAELLKEVEEQQVMKSLEEQKKIEYAQTIKDLEDAHNLKEVELQSLILELDADKKALEDKRLQEKQWLENQLMENFKKREQQIKQDMEGEIQNAMLEKSKIEKQLKQQCSQEQELRSTIDEINTRHENYVQQAALDIEQSKVKVLSSLENMVESELVCAICSELFIQATSLTCSHAFCHLCIEKWLVQKEDCPNCRQKVSSRVRSLVLDNYIDKLMEMLGEDTRANRQMIITEREAEQKLWDEEVLRKAQAKNATKDSIRVVYERPVPSINTRVLLERPDSTRVVHERPVASNNTRALLERPVPTRTFTNSRQPVTTERYVPHTNQTRWDPRNVSTSTNSGTGRDIRTARDGTGRNGGSYQYNNWWSHYDHSSYHHNVQHEGQQYYFVPYM